MASPAWFHGFMHAFTRDNRYSTLFSMSDRDLARRGYDRAGLTRSFITGIGGY